MIYNGDAADILKTLPDESVHCCVTSPPYFGLRDYGVDGQIGLEETPDQYIDRLLTVFKEVRRVLRKDGTLWLNVGDSYCGTQTGSVSQESSRLQGGKKTQIEAAKRPCKKPSGNIKSKDLIGIPWMLAFALRADGWYLRQDIIWAKPNPMPESVTDRCTKAHEYIFLLSKSRTYYYDADAIKEPCVWDTGGLTEARTERASEEHKAMPTVYKNGIRPKKKCPQTFGGSKAREGQENGGDPKNGQRSDKNSQWGKVWDSDSPLRNKRDVWTVSTQPYSEAHFATFPKELIRPCILAGCPAGGTVIDPFFGSGTTGEVALEENRNFIGIELNPEYIKIAQRRISNVQTKMII